MPPDEASGWLVGTGSSCRETVQEFREIIGDWKAERSSL